LKFYEYKAKEIFSKYGIPIPKGLVLSDFSQLKDFDFPVAIKAQVLVGGRGKAGGIKFANNLKEARRAIQEILGMEISGYKVKRVLVEEQLRIEKELYLSLMIDRSARSSLLMASIAGGMDIEEVPEEKIFKKHISPLLGIQPYVLREMRKFLNLPKEIAENMSEITRKMYNAFVAEDAELLEINPLALTKEGKLVAGDAKLVVDDNAIFRHPEYKDLDQDLTPLEKEARDRDIAFIQLPGDIGVIANGAGLTMATLDVLKLKGGRGGVFLDLGGTDDPEKVKEAFTLMARAKPSVILMNIFGGITKCDTVALGVKEAFEEHKIEVPVIARIKGLHEKEAKAILKDAGMVPADTMEEAAEQAARLRGG